MEIDLCKFSNEKVTWSLQSNPSTSGMTSITDAVLVKIFIAFRIQICPDGTQALFIDDCVYLDTKDYWNYVYFQQSGLIPYNDVVPVSSIRDCIYSVPDGATPTLRANIMNMAIEAAIEQLLDSVGITTQTNYTVFRKSGCYSTVKLSFPAGSFIVSAPDDNGNTTVTNFTTNNTTIMQNIPCSEICCKSEYKWEVVSLSNGETRSIWTKIRSYSESSSCTNQPLPEYSKYSNKAQAQMIDPNTGDTIWVDGSVVEQSECISTCVNDDTSPTNAFMMNKKEKNEDAHVHQQAELKVLTDADQLKINGSTSINKVIIFNMSGQKIEHNIMFKNNTFDISYLKTGIYFARIYFDDKTYQTIKFIK